MLKNRSERYTEELRDPALSALLREALDDDAALLAAPGRTDRVMRKVLASGIRPPRRFSLAPLAWGAGAFAAAAAAVLLLFTVARLPLPVMPSAPSAPSLVTMPAPPNGRHPAVPPTRPRIEDIAVAPAPVVIEHPRTAWTPVAAPPHQPGAGPRDRRPADRSTSNPAVAEGRLKVAASLIDAGKAALDAGDYETAYHAYQASYEVSPTPDALLASGAALEQLTEEALDSGDLST